MGFEFTKEQRLAIEERGTSLLVSAAAGSGKTRVLTERLMRYVTDPDSPRDIDSFLIITYTRAAAAQLKSRVSGALAALAAENPGSVRLRRQQNLSYRAHIGTIHSFCTELLRENCHLLGLPPGFTVLDEDKAAVLQQTVLERVLDARYEKMDADDGFTLLVDTVGAGRDDSRLALLVLELCQKMRAHPYPEDWAREQAGAMDAGGGISDAGGTVWGRELLRGTARSARFWTGRMESAAAEIRAAGGKIEKAYLPSFETTRAALGAFITALEDGWDAASACLPIPFPRLGALRNYDDPDLAAGVKAARDGCKKAAESWRASLAGTSDELIADMRKTAPAMRALLELTLDFEKTFSAEKRRRGCVDFPDLEHFAARLLVDRETGAPTWIAVETAQRYTEIMVDEYQDVNAVQELIFSAVSRGGRNLFLVGDVKQSIYRFRLAEPGIFLKKSESWPDAGAPVAENAPAPAGRRILLRENFRSRENILRAVNHVFSNIMSRDLGELDYDDTAALRFGAAGYPEGGDAPVELNIIDPERADDVEDSPEKAALEARFIADKINEMIAAGTPVYEDGTPRRCNYGDFALLMRSPSSNGAVFRRVLAEAGIPVQARQGGGFFTRVEITTAVNLLCVVDNPHADVPLISVLRSPAFAFSPDELAEIRAASSEGDYYTALCAAAGNGNARCADFLRLLGSLRSAAPEEGVCGLLRRIYVETDLFALCSAMNGASERRESLNCLFELAQGFEAGGESGILRFTSWLRRLAERGEEPAVGSGDGCVRIMSIHRSKGLEFPFVFLCDLSHRFNRQDLSAAVLVHTELGLGPKLTDAGRGIEYPTLARRAIGSRLLDETLSEEMRVLYVGLTRARERLFMTCTMKNAAVALEKLRLGDGGPIAPELLRSAGCFSRWLASAALTGDAGGIVTNIISPSSAPEREKSVLEAPEADGDTYERVRSLLDWRYGHARAVSLPSKLTATGLKGRADDAERMGECVLMSPDEDAPRFRRPEFGRAAGIDASGRGTATHALLQHIDLRRAADAAAVRAELERLGNCGILTSEQVRAADVGAVTRFGQSELCRRILSAQEVRREFRFTVLADASEYFDVPGGEHLLMQGVVDCFIVEDGGITVIDYKTDRVSADEAAERARVYAPQLDAYARALERIRGLPVREKIVYFLTPGLAFVLTR